MTDSLSYTPFYLYDTTGVAAAREVAQPLSFDSVFNIFRKGDTLLRESLFSDHLLQCSHSEALPHTYAFPQSWVFVVCLVLIIIVAVFFKSYRLKISDVAEASFSSRALGRILRDNNMSHTKSWILVGFLHPLAVAMILFYYSNDTELDFLRIQDVVFYLLLFVACVALYFLRNALVRVFGNVFQGQQTIQQYLYSNYCWHLLECVLLIPLIGLLFYVPSISVFMGYILLILGGACFLMRIFRNLQTVLTIPNASRFYLFYYLCIVELIPIVALVYAVVSWSLGS